MAIILDNRLNGPVGQEVTNASLAASGFQGTVTGLSLGERAVYSDTRTVHDFSTIELSTGYHRDGTPRFRVDLPPTGPWSARWYVWMPNMQDAGHGINEVRWHCRFPDTGLGYVNHTTAAGNIGSRLQPDGLADPPITWDDESGSAVAAGQWWRIEPVYDGTDLVVRVYAGHNTTGARVHTWNNLDVGRTLEITGYRYRRGVLLQQGATGDEVVARQNQLIILSYLGSGDNDGIYGQGTAAAVQQFQVDYGVWPQDGEIGPETGAALDLAAWEAEGHTTPPPLYISHVAVGEGELIGPAPDWVDVEVVVEDTAEFSLSMDVEDTTKTVQDTSEFDLTVDELSMGVGTDVSDTAEFDLTSEITLKTSDEGSSNTAVFDLEIDYSVESLIPDPPPIPPQWRLAVYFPAAGLRGYMYHMQDWSASIPFNDVGSLEFTHSKHHPEYALISDGAFEVALEVRDTDSSIFYEPPGCRFLAIKSTEDLADRAGMVRWTMPAYSWLLSKARTIRGIFTNGTRKFTNTTPGGVLRTLLDEADNFQVFDDLTYQTIDASTDSSYNAWVDTGMDIEYAYGTSLLSALEGLAAQGSVDWRMHRRALSVYNMDTTLRRDRTNHRIGLDSNVLEAPREFTRENLAGRIGARGDDYVAQVARPEARSPWGLWEDVADLPGLSGINDITGTMLRIGSTQMVEETVHTRRVVLTGKQSLPLVDYMPGDDVRVDLRNIITGELATVTRRVSQVSLSCQDGRTVEAIISLGGRHIDPVLQAQHKLNAVTSQIHVIGGSGTWPRPGL